MKRKLTSLIMMAVLMVILTGCGKSWTALQRPETPEELIAVEKFEREILATPAMQKKLQDMQLYHFNNNLYEMACKACCKRRWYETDAWGNTTGRMSETPPNWAK